LLVALPSVIASSGLIGDFELSLKGGKSEAVFKFNPRASEVVPLCWTVWRRC